MVCPERDFCIVHLALENAAVVSLMTWIRFCKLHSLSWCQQQAARKKINKWEAKQKINVVFTQTIVTYKMANHCFLVCFNGSFSVSSNAILKGKYHKTKTFGCIERSYDYQASKSPNQVEIAEQAIKTQSINQKHMQWERRKAKQCWNKQCNCVVQG